MSDKKRHEFTKCTGFRWNRFSKRKGTQRKGSCDIDLILGVSLLSLDCLGSNAFGILFPKLEIE
jgi:hypothetical protein